MLRILNLEEVEELLLELPTLVHLQELRAAEFTSSLASWLGRLEKAFEANRSHQAGLVAALRSGLLAAERGHVPAGLEFRGRVTRSKVLTAVQTQAIQRAAEIAATLIGENRPRVADAERVAQLIVATARSRALVLAPPPGVSRTQYLRGLRAGVAAVPELESAAIHLEGLVGATDALIFLDRALSRQWLIPMDAPVIARTRG